MVSTSRPATWRRMWRAAHLRSDSCSCSNSLVTSAGVDCGRLAATCEPPRLRRCVQAGCTGSCCSGRCGSPGVRNTECHNRKPTKAVARLFSRSKRLRRPVTRGVNAELKSPGAGSIHCWRFNKVVGHFLLKIQELLTRPIKVCCA